jgi:hypothetical protein
MVLKLTQKRIDRCRNSESTFLDCYYDAAFNLCAQQTTHLASSYMHGQALMQNRDIRTEDTRHKEQSVLHYTLALSRLARPYSDPDLVQTADIAIRS